MAVRPASSVGADAVAAMVMKMALAALVPLTRTVLRRWPRNAPDGELAHQVLLFDRTACEVETASPGQGSLALLTCERSSALSSCLSGLSRLLDASCWARRPGA